VQKEIEKIKEKKQKLSFKKIFLSFQGFENEERKILN